jgi:divalent metal cation (Fe/Co/Zn/Cd) transporter
VRSRGGPGNVFIDLHIHVAPDLTVDRAHDISHQVIDAIKAQLDGVTDVTVHTEPEGHH